MIDFTSRAAEATMRMRELFPETPLQLNDHLSNIYGAKIWLKREDLSPVRSYSYVALTTLWGSRKISILLFVLVLETMRRAWRLCVGTYRKKA